MRFRVVFFDTVSENKWHSEHRYEYLADRKGAWQLWFWLVKILGKKHVEIYDLNGTLQEPEKGISGIVDYSL